MQLKSFPLILLTAVYLFIHWVYPLNHSLKQFGQRDTYSTKRWASGLRRNDNGFYNDWTK